nr:unnamed protein product [Digitaria exilis]
MLSSYAAAAAGSSSRKPNRTSTASVAAARPPAPSPSPAPAPPAAYPSAVSDSDPSSYSSSSGDDADLTASDSATASVVSAYLSVAGEGADLSKVGIFLSSAARRRSPPCLICFDPIRPSDPVWSCSSSCFAILHLSCIQSWAHQSASGAAVPCPTWGCPKCRFAYTKSQTPTSYLCFCSKTEDPAPDPWILPHSCGDVCGRRLNANVDSGCEHTCLLLLDAAHISVTLVRGNATNDLAVDSTGVRCPERCHRGPCDETCRLVITKSCRCGGLKKEVPCYQELTCERKCQRLRNCGRHACKRRCCAGDCPPCSETCDRKLRCGNHKCLSPCHRGACSPCPLMKTISCACGKTCFEVPCGTEKNQKPPKCSKKCNIPRLCRHKLECRPHKCHYGACPPCKLTCGEELSCGHICKERCHGPISPPNPEFTLKPTKRKMEKHIECTPGTPCPPCKEVVLVPCLGQHLGQERAAREPPCLHRCPLRCHLSDCLPCKVLVKKPCHCGAMVHAFECVYFNNLKAKEQLKVRSCGGPCHRKLPNCPHLCSEVCHPGTCPSVDQCMKKVNVRCACNTLKQEWICQDVLKEYRNSGRDPKEVSKSQFGAGLLACDDNCKKKLKAPDSELHLRKTQENKSPIVEVANVPKRRKRRDRGQEEVKASKFQEVKTYVLRVLLIIFLSIIAAAGLYLLWKGIFRLSDWMNEMEEHKARQRHLRGSMS